MNNKIKSISHRSFGFRTAENFIAAIYIGAPIAAEIDKPALKTVPAKTEVRRAI